VPGEKKMIAKKLSKTVVERIKVADRDVVVWDDTLPGFGVRVKPSWVRSYIIQYRNRNTSDRLAGLAAAGEHFGWSTPSS
jgi:hypothetical protein